VKTIALALILATGLAIAPAESSEAIQRGRRTFAQQCASCHSSHSANSLAGPGLKGYYTTHRPKPSDASVRTVIVKGKGRMPAFGALGSARTDELIAYLKTL
jgi:mono/diheme cytochrome c family protein